MLLSRGVSANDVDDLVQDAFVRLETYQRAHEVVSEEAFLVRAAVQQSQPLTLIVNWPALLKGSAGR